MLANSLVTNEIKNASGVEQEFGRISQGDRTTEYALLTEGPATPHRLSIKHTEIGTGVDARRRSVVRFDLKGLGDIDTSKMVQTSAYLVVDIPVGNISAYDSAKTVLANLLSFCASLGATTTILYDCTGNGAATLINGSL